MEHIKKISLPLEANSLISYLEIPSRVVALPEEEGGAEGYYEVDEVYAPRILRELESLGVIKFPTFSQILETKYKMNSLPF